MNIIINSENIKDAISSANATRLANPNAWLFISITVGKINLMVKTYGTSIQRMTCDGISHSSTFDAKVSDWKKAIESALQYHLVN